MGIASNTVKRQRSRLMEMRCFWIGDKVSQEMYDITWHTGMENLADYQSKHHIGSHHVAVRPYYLHQENSSRILPGATKHSTLKGCIGTQENGCARNVPLPKIPQIQSTSQIASVLIRRNHTNTWHSRIPWIPTYSELRCSPEGFGTIPVVPFFPLVG